MGRELIIPQGWLAKVSAAVDISEGLLSNMVHRMFDYGASKAEIENAMVMLAKTKGKTLVFVSSEGKN